MLKLVKIITCIIFPTILILPLSGCLFGGKGYIHNRESDYLQSKNEPTLKLPPKLSGTSMKPAFPIPRGKAFSEPSKPSLTPPGNQAELSSLDDVSSKVAMKSAIGQGNEGFPVLKLQASYPSSWKRINLVLPRLGYQIIGTDMKTGVIEVMSPTNKKQTADIMQFKVVEGGKGTLISVLDQTGDMIAAVKSSPILKALQKILGP